MPGLVKIGMTSNTVEERVAEISNATGVPGRFDIYHVVPVVDICGVEREIHSKLKNFRVIVHKEFFELKPSVAKDYVDRIVENVDFGVKMDSPGMRFISDAKSLGKLVRWHRKRQGLTQRDVARKIRSGLRFIVNVEQGKPTAQMGKIFMVMEALGIGVALKNREDKS